MRLRIVCFGKLTAPYYESGVADYIGRLQRWSTVEIVQLPERKGPDALTRERDDIQKRLAGCDRIVALDRTGKAISSEDWGRMIEGWRQDGVRIGLVIGSADGLHPEILAAAHHRVSFGPITLPHSLARLVLAEQLYRAHTIALGLPYHLGH